MKLKTEIGLLENTEFIIEKYHIGMFHEKYSNMEASNYECFFEHPPIIYEKNNKLVLLNNHDTVLTESLMKIDINCKTLVYKISNTDLNYDTLLDAFKLLNLKYLSRKILLKSISHEIISNNRALDLMCNKKSNQLGYINKFFCKDKISSQKLSIMNREIDASICIKFLHDRGIENCSFEKINELLNMIRCNEKHSEKNQNSNNKIFLSDILVSLSESVINSIEDIFNIVQYLINKHNLRRVHLHEFKKLISSINHEIKSKISLTDLLIQIQVIEEKRSNLEDGEFKGYNFITDALIDKNVDTNIVVKYIANKIIEKVDNQ